MHETFVLRAQSTTEAGQPRARDPMHAGALRKAGPWLLPVHAMPRFARLVLAHSENLR